MLPVSNEWVDEVIIVCVYDGRCYSEAILVSNGRPSRGTNSSDSRTRICEQNLTEIESQNSTKKRNNERNKNPQKFTNSDKHHMHTMVWYQSMVVLGC